ncbi:hypothetical protein [Streptomyces sp. NPDC088816]|uniref:hypothetical protein n=1 Tax=Streptomyces sp. NPDC088816 TaxID=3365906 RepID=UPI00381E93B5
MSGDTAGGQVSRKRPRVLERARVGWPRALRELKDLLYEVYLAAGAPSLDEITADIAADDTLAGAPERDTVRRCISDPSPPPKQADAVSVATVLARRAAWDAQDLAGRVRDLWVQARMAQGVGRPISEFSDHLVLADLEVHPALDTGGAHHRFGALPAYIPREHDTRLEKVVAAAAAGSSGVAVLVGGSSTGKTRALWEAVRQLPAPWRLWHPISPSRPDAALADLADIAPHTVVWLNEAQHYLGPDPLGEQVAAGLRDLLHDPSRAPVLVLATLWPDHWQTLTTRTAPDRHADARHLLHGHEIDVPDAFTRADLAALAGTADPRLAEAAERAHDAQVTQYLAGVPVLTARYDTARGVTRALIHAAMDARRLGAGPHIPLAWLADAAPGYLTDTEWHTTSGDWLSQALDYVTQECNGIPGILTPVKTTAPRNQRNRRPATTSSTALRESSQDSQGPHYLLADYLDQYGRHHRADEIPPIDFWTAAAHHAHPTDWDTLGTAAWNRGLYRDAAQLHKHAAAHGNSHALHNLIGHFQDLHPTDPRPAQWAAAHTPLDNPHLAVWLLDGLWKVGAQEQVDVLLARDPAAHAALDNPRSVADLLYCLRRVGAQEQVAALAARAAAHAPLDNPHSVADLLDGLRGVGAQEQVAALAARAAAHAPLDNAGSVVWLLYSLRRVGAQEQVAALAARAAAHAPLDNAGSAAVLLDGLRKVGAQEQVDVLLARDPATHAPLDHPYSLSDLLDGLPGVGAQKQVAARAAAHAPLDNPHSVARLLDCLRGVGAQEQVAALAARAAAHAPLDNPHSVVWLLYSLRRVGAQEQVAALAARAAAHAPLDNAGSAAVLLDGLRRVGAQEQVDVLLARDPATHAPLDNAGSVVDLLDGLRGVGAQEQVAALAARAAAHAPLDNAGSVTRLLNSLREIGAQEQVDGLVARLPTAGHFNQFIKVGDNREQFRFGREPDGSVAPSWTWDDLE